MAAELAPYVSFLGVIDSEGKVQIESVAPADSMPQQPVTDARDAPSCVFVELQDKAGTVLLRYVFEIQVMCMHPSPDMPQPPDEYIVGGILPIPRDASTLRIVDANSVLAERKIPEQGPELMFEWIPSPSSINGVQKIGWKATHPEEAVLANTLCLVRQDGQWQALALPSQATEVEINFDELSGGAVALGVTSTDGFYVARAQSPIFQLPLKPCVPMIFSPREGARFRAGEPVFLFGRGHYRENGAFEDRWLFWSDDIDGQLGPGREFGVTLKPGKHALTLRAGSPGREGSAQVNILVEENK